MRKKIYKYIGAEILELAFKKENFCGLKCSYPKDYNDPYELFLTIDFNDTPDVLAFYKEVIDEIDQHPTTCFSKSPIVTPMWAHYANNSKGFVLEIDEDKLTNYIDPVGLSDVTYQNEPRPDLKNTLQMAYVRRKPRDLMFLKMGVDYAAYFTKNSCWSYELERRLVLSDDHVSDIAGNMILFIPTDCISAIIAGSRTEPDFIKAGVELSDQIDAQYFQAIIGKTNSFPHLMDKNNNTFIFDGSNIVKSPYSCNSCKEPIAKDNQKLCSWCSITEEDKFNASINPLRMFADTGILDEYLDGFYKIGR
jgi:hypothetical protein